jgi:hypothetical protein
MPGRRGESPLRLLLACGENKVSPVLAKLAPVASLKFQRELGYGCLFRMSNRAKVNNPVTSGNYAAWHPGLEVSRSRGYAVQRVRINRLRFRIPGH